ncbi:MAG TPA: UDP-N-acetylglucosamine 1-carboxyvinyltransferase [Anaerolineales bacterium]|nr:UDP-N-acetylglucosamine 1-carboxyvinyltransferase [Anaerolineales bacterium]HLB49959.1 UDP-N-acetylglucosamine 1-carboxyvinyltransferase [Anaerolineales bacterium]
MEQFIIEGGRPLNGIVRPSGNKNAALPLLAACLLTDQPVVMRNVPTIRDVLTMRQLLLDVGATIEEIDSHTLRIDARNLSNREPNPDLCRAIRASMLLAGPMLARVGQITLPPPGGDVIGRRRLDTHLLAFEAMGAEANFNGRFELKTSGLHGADILLDEASVTGTENAMMAAVLAKGATQIRNAASEPHVQELCLFLNQLGARISGIGSNTLTIDGVPALHGGEFTIGPDYLEVVSFIGAAAVTGGSIRIENAGPQYLDMISLVFRRLGVEWQVDGADLVVPANQSLSVVPDLGGAIPEIKTNVWPAFPTDLTSIAIAVATQAKGSILFHDWMHSGRMYFIDKLVAMGARIILCDPHRCLVQGPNRLMGERLESPDIRAGMSLLIAALCAEGTSVIRNIGQIERGYERIDEKLRALGASIQRAQA